jgi:hypothetical protein
VSEPSNKTDGISIQSSRVASYIVNPAALVTPSESVTTRYLVYAELLLELLPFTYLWFARKSVVADLRGFLQRSEHKQVANLPVLSFQAAGCSRKISTRCLPYFMLSIHIYATFYKEYYT